MGGGLTYVSVCTAGAKGIVPDLLQSLKRFYPSLSPRIPPPKLFFLIPSCARVVPLVPRPINDQRSGSSGGHHMQCNYCENTGKQINATLLTLLGE